MSDLKEKIERRELLADYNVEELQAAKERGQYERDGRKYNRYCLNLYIKLNLLSSVNYKNHLLIT